MARPIQKAFTGDIEVNDPTPSAPSCVEIYLLRLRGPRGAERVDFLAAVLDDLAFRLPLLATKLARSPLPLTKYLSQIDTRSC
jgi:hypothetical protein